MWFTSDILFQSCLKSDWKLSLSCAGVECPPHPFSSVSHWSREKERAFGKFKGLAGFSSLRLYTPVHPSTHLSPPVIRFAAQTLPRLLGVWSK